MAPCHITLSMSSVHAVRTGYGDTSSPSDGTSSVSSSVPPPLAEYYQAYPTLACVDIGESTSRGLHVYARRYSAGCHRNWWQQWRLNRSHKSKGLQAYVYRDATWFRLERR